jgi:hypothetical protein
MKPIRLLVALLLVMIPGINAFAQNDSTFIARATKKMSQQPTVEKVYLQLDKPYYAAGDDIWFKAYVTSGSRHTLSTISGVLNVELINGSNRIEHSVKLPIISGLSWGDFRLPDTIRSGYYRIRAYTQWMRNAGADYFYNKTLYIGNTIAAAVTNSSAHKKAEQKKADQVKSEVNVNKQQSAITDVQFFAESGNLLYGVNSKIAFKAVGNDGLGKDIKGVITDQNNNEIVRFSSRHLGMGEFNLVPAQGKVYKALITFADGSEKGMSLPAPQDKGYVMHIDNSDPLFIELKIEKGTKDDTDGINLLVQSGGEVCYAAQSKSQQSSTTMIPKSKFPDGIAQFTLFSDKGEPLNERLVFIQHNRQIDLSVNPEGTNFASRGKMKIDVAAKNEQGKPVFGNFSVAVTDETKVPVNESAEGTIFSNLLLTSDLKGYIEDPGYYFTPQSAEAVADLDVLMLTQGYRRFEWKQILNNNAQPKYTPETSLAISGKLTSLGGGKAIPGGHVSLLSSSGGFAMLDTVADDQGHFVFKNLQFKDSLKFVIQSKKDKGNKNLRIEMDSINRPPVTWAMLPPASDTGFSVYINNSKRVYDKEISYGIKTKVTALKEVEIKDKIIKLNSSNLNGPGNADQVVLTKDLPPGGGTIAEWMMGKLRGVFFQFDPEEQVYFPCTYESGKPVQMGMMLNGIKIDANTLASLPPEIIESVEVLRSGSYTSIYGGDAYNGLILFNTKKGMDYKASTNMKIYRPQGYYKAREFYSPQYDQLKNQPKVDLRTTIYWNPNIATDKDGNACFEYFNADAKGTYRLVIEGIDANGDLGRQVYRYKVE